MSNSEYADQGDPTEYNPHARPAETLPEWEARMADPMRKWLRAEARYNTWVENLEDEEAA